MATGYSTLLDLAARTGSDAIIGLIEDVTTYAPEFSVMPAVARPGTTYKVTRRTALPTAAFRNPNGTGVTIGKSIYKQETKEMYFLDCQLQADEAIVKADSKDLSDFLTDEASGALQSATIAIGAQMYYGTTADANGFGGLLSQSVGKVSTGGTTNSTSAYLVWVSPQGVCFTVGNDGAISMPDWRPQYITSGTTQKLAWMSNLSSYLGLQVGSDQSIWRVSGVTAAAPLTDARGNLLLSKVPIARRQGLRWFMNRTAAYTLQASRSAIANQNADQGGGMAFSGEPTSLAGIPITVTDSLLDTETNAGSADAYATE